MKHKSWLDVKRSNYLLLMLLSLLKRLIPQCNFSVISKTSSLHISVVSVAFLACTASLVQLGHQAVMDVTDVMGVKELKMTGAGRERLDPRDLLVIWALLV